MTFEQIDTASLPWDIEVHEHIWIPLADGERLAARLWLPVDAFRRPVPAILEYIPYRKRDLTRARDALTHPWLAGHGYACIRVDLRGSGESDGVLKDQYREQELDDGVQVINWLSEQPWCDGNVGMMGISWGGFNALQVAAKRPQALKAVISACSTDDLYVDNMHYMGGCLLTDNLSESTTMFTANSSPPDPELVGERWREMWLQRLEGSGLWLETWLRHQHRDSYWHHGSVCEDYGAIQCPVMAIGGWADGYTNAIFRLLAHLDVPRQGLIGPWGHKYPHQGIPGPAIGFLQESLRWWDRWLKDIDTGIMKEPMLRAWMQDSVPPTTYYHERPGRWVGENEWPSKRIDHKRFVLKPLCLVPDDTVAPHNMPIDLTISSPLSVGLFAGKWCSYAAAPDLPHDQREEDGGALIFESEPLAEDIEILGAPSLKLTLSSNQAIAMIAARLSDVAPTDKATRVTYGLLNLNHRYGHDHPENLMPGEEFVVELRLNHIAQVFPAGHRLRLSLSTSYWPLAWPPPRPVQLTIKTLSSYLSLPIRPRRDADIDIHFESPQGTQQIAITQLEPPHHNWLVHRDLAEDLSTLEVIQDQGKYRIEQIDLDVTNRIWNWYSYRDDDFCSPKGETRTERCFRRGDWSVRTTTHTVLTADNTNFYIWAELDAWEGKKRIFSRNWDVTIPRLFL
ncbi:CocE/NonD family hydrolase [Methylophaga sp. OBS4]|uniref:CocE/NonD family hydrolase n=1 Tax=Methylophaga sp. OBS4 TaxID=2991935 RepID=UPI0022575050|nr:CocE/NonD family hydrolase [Methylophaga sp. OBS4]MCX4187879.1 CocE/NonD family hydrolase [Methylophaga sp. OBS4]